MHRYWWPGYEMQLLGELQRQQNCAHFCDTLLQTEGISVPTHSCVLAALSPYLYQKLSASPSPPSGQKRRLQLQTVTAQTLLKLVGLLYSGELEVRGNKEQNDVLAAAHQFGIGDLVLGCKDAGVNRGELLERRQSVGNRTENESHVDKTTERHRNLKMQDAQVQVEISGRKENDPLVKKKSFVSTGTQTIKACVTSGVSPELFSVQTTPPGPECPSFVATFPISPQPQSIALDEQSGPSSGSVTNPTSSSTLSTSFSEDSSSLRSKEENVFQRLSASGEDAFGLTGGRPKQDDGNANGKSTEDFENAEQTGQANGNEREETGNSTEKGSVVRVAGKSLEKMKETNNRLETTEIGVKVKLRRRAKGEAWEVVNKQDTEETALVLTSVTQKTPQKDLTEVQNLASSVQSPEAPDLRPDVATSPNPPKHSSCETEPGSDVTRNRSNKAEPDALPPPRSSVEESEEDIDRMLDEIMMGLNILPNLDSDCKKAQRSHEGEQNFPVLDSDTGSTLTTADCVFYQDLETQRDHLAADAGVHCCFRAQNQPDCSALSAVQPDLRKQQQQAEFSSSVRSSGRSDGTNCQGMPGHRRVTSLYPQTTGSILSPTCFPSLQKPHYPGSLQPSSQNHQSLLDLLPLSHGNETQAGRAFSLPRLSDLRLPLPVSPLGPCGPEAQQQQHPNKSLNPDNYIQLSFSRRPWFIDPPWSLQFPFSTPTENKRRSSQGASSCGAEKSERCVGGKPNERRTCAESCVVGGREERGTKSTPPETCEIRKLKKRKEVSAAGRTSTLKKRRRTDFLQAPEGRCLASKPVKVSDEKITLCSTSFSSSDGVLAKERNATVGPSNVTSAVLDKPSRVSAITASVGERTRVAGSFRAEQTPIRTRGFMKRSKDKVPEKCVLIPVVCRAVVDNKQGVTLPKRKRGRPRKIRLQEPPSNGNPVITENRSHDEASELRGGEDSLKEEEDEEKKRRDGNLIRNSNEAGADNLKKTASAEHSEEAKADGNIKNTENRKRSWMVSLKEFKKLFTHQHSKTRKSAESQEATESGKEERRDARKGSEKEAETDVKESVKVRDQVAVDATVDKNPNQPFSTAAAQSNESRQEGPHGFAGRKSSFDHGDRTASLPDVPEQEAARESGRPRKDPQEEAFSFEGSNALQPFTDDEGASRRDVNKPEGTKKALAPNVHPQKTGPPLSGADGIVLTLDCDQDEGEEEEVDILLYSPKKEPLTPMGEDGLNKVVICVDDEEEEDINEIDVTGDETE